MHQHDPQILLKTSGGHAEFLPLAETLSSLIALIQGDRLVYVNPAGCALLGRSKEWLLGRRFWEVVHPSDRQRAIERGQRRQAGIPQERRILERLVHATGHTVWMDYAVDLIRVGGKATTLVTGHDVTEQRRIQERLRRSEARLAEAQQIGHIGSWEWDVAADTLTWSEELCRIYGIEPTAFGAGIDGYLELVHHADRAPAREELQRALGRGGPFAFEHRVVRTDGEVRTISGRGEVFLDTAGRPVRVAGTGQDITERRLIQERLRRSEDRFRLAFLHAAIGKAIIAPDGKIEQVNPAACRVLDYAEAELVGLDLEAIAHPADHGALAAILRKLFEGPFVSAAIDQRLLRKDGRVVQSHLSATVVRDPAGQPLYLIAEFEDVTERTRAQRALEESEQRFRNLCMQAPVMLMAFDPDGHVREVSQCWLQTTGYERDEVIGREGWAFITPDSQTRLRNAIEASQRSNEVVIKGLPLRAVCKDGTAIDLLSTSVAEVDDRGEPQGAICVQINLTDLQRAEAALRESEERYRALVEHAPEAITVLDVDLERFVDANAHAEKLFGFSRERLLQMGPLDFCSDHQAGGRPSCDVIEDEHRRVLAGGTAVFEFTHVDASGREIVCHTRLARLPAAGRRLIRATITDVTELKQLQEKVRHAEKLAAVGVLAAGVAHEIGNPLMALSMAAQSLERRSLERGEPDPYTQSKLALVREHIDRISRIVRQMSDLARPRSAQVAQCDLSRVVRRAVEMVRYDSRAGDTEIRYELAEHLPAVEAVEDELTQVCINLALNAFDAMAVAEPGQPRRLTIKSWSTADAVSVSFGDTGPGVPRSIQDSIFQPFFTTKESGGSGLGLSISFRILEQHRGSLRLDATAAPGATFVVALPRNGAR